ncbi:MAG: MFS transporter [Actinobacteria bacterium]|nr:MFS transporter [Actinomycetota bacterium]
MNTPQRRALGALFFIYAFGLMSWIPRFPEIKKNLGVSLGEFGSLISFSALGSLVSLLSVGLLVNRFGVRKLIISSAIILFGSIMLVVHLHNTWQFLLCNIAIGIGTSAMHTSINGQALHEQGDKGENLMPRLHGLWSLGALTSAVVSGLLAGRVSLVAHVDLLCGVVFICVLLLVHRLRESLLPPNKSKEAAFSIKSVFTGFDLDWKMSVAFTFAIALEFATGDWAAIFSKEQLHMSAGVSAIPYALFVFAMIIGRLTIHKLNERWGLAFLIRRFVVTGGTTFLISVIVGVEVSKNSPLIGFVITAVGSFVGGLGASFLAPTIMDSANKRSKSSGAVVVGQLGAVNTVFIFIIKSVIAWTAQITSVGFALIIPSVMLICVAFSAQIIEEARR